MMGRFFTTPPKTFLFHTVLFVLLCGRCFNIFLLAFFERFHMNAKRKVGEGHVAFSSSGQLRNLHGTDCSDWSKSDETLFPKNNFVKRSGIAFLSGNSVTGLFDQFIVFLDEEKKV